MIWFFILRKKFKNLHILMGAIFGYLSVYDQDGFLRKIEGLRMLNFLK